MGNGVGVEVVVDELFGGEVVDLEVGGGGDVFVVFLVDEVVFGVVLDFGDVVVGYVVLFVVD